MTDRIPEPIIIYEVPSDLQIIEEAYTERHYGWRTVKVKIGPRTYPLCRVNINAFGRRAIIRKMAGGSYTGTFIRKLVHTLKKYGFEIITEVGREE